jgi:transcriptional regulator with XRE-family HTH domain
MSWNIAFDRTLKEFGISAKWLAERSGITPQSISRFRKGHGPMTTDNLNLLLSHLPYEARAYFFSNILGSSLDTTQLPPLSEQIAKLSVQSKKELVIEIVDSLVGEREPEAVAS